jgi:hypothetical protein
MPPDARLPRRNAAAIKAPRFPILPFDEWRISLARGSALSLGLLMPGESLVSILWKFACAKALPGHALLHLISPEVDPHEGVAPVRDAVDLTRLCRVLRLPLNVLRTSLPGAAPHDRYHEVFRYCRQCAAHGYHSVLFQREDENLCPAHHALSALQRRDALHNKRQRDRSAVSMWLVPFALQLRAAFAALDDVCDAPAGPHRYQSPIAPALGQRHRRCASRTDGNVRW